MLLGSLSFQTFKVRHLVRFVATRVIIIFFCHGISTSTSATLTFVFAVETSQIAAGPFRSSRVRKDGSSKPWPLRRISSSNTMEQACENKPISRKFLVVGTLGDNALGYHVAGWMEFVPFFPRFYWVGVACGSRLDSGYNTSNVFLDQYNGRITFSSNVLVCNR